MSYIRVDSPTAMYDGQTITFKSPADCSQITGLIVYYPEGNGTTSKDFKFVDAHGVDVGSGTISLFAANVLVKVVLDIDDGKAYVQNADTNAYLEGKLAEKYSSQNKPSAADVTAGTFAGKAKANPSAAASVGDAQVRDIYAGTADMVAGSSALATGTLYVVYE